jgi:hypothetical protein
VGMASSSQEGEGVGTVAKEPLGFLALAPGGWQKMDFFDLGLDPPDSLLAASFRRRLCLIASSCSCLYFVLRTRRGDTVAEPEIVAI